MASMNENERVEYSVLMSRARDTERTSQMCWIASGIAAVILLSWAIAAKSPGLMLPVILAVAYGFYAMAHGRQQTNLISGYVKEFYESEESGPQWFTRLGHLEIVPGFNPSANDWLCALMANAVIVAAVVFSWLFAAAAPRGELYAGIVTGCALAFAFHSITETTRMRQSDSGAFWHQVGTGPAEERRPPKFAGRF